MKCGHCDSIMERRNLKSHTTRMHEGLIVTEKPATNQSTSSFPVKSVKRTEQSSNNNNEDAKRTRVNEDEPSEKDTSEEAETNLTN